MLRLIRVDRKKITVILIGILVILVLIGIAMRTSQENTEKYNNLLRNITQYDTCSYVSEVANMDKYRCCNDVSPQIKAMNISLGNNRVYTCDFLTITKKGNKIEVVKG